METLLLDLLEWLAARPRAYAEVMDAWRTSCPSFPVWEEATDRGYVVRRFVSGRGTLVTLSPAGEQRLRLSRA